MKRKILKNIVDDFLSMSLEEIKAYSEQIHFNEEPFATLQEMSDAVEFSEEYQNFILRDSLKNFKNELSGLKIYCNINYNSSDPITYSYSKNMDRYSYIEDGGMLWVA